MNASAIQLSLCARRCSVNALPSLNKVRIMVWQVLDLLAKGLSWEQISELCHHSISAEAIAEAVKLSGEAFLKHAEEFEVQPAPA